MRNILLFCCLTFNLCHLYGQEVLASGGNFLSNANGSFSFTIGEMVTETFTIPNGFLTQGFQQSFLETNSLTDNNFLDPQLYPNPCSDYFEIVNLPQNFSREVVLLTIGGSEVLRSKTNGKAAVTIDVSPLDQATYLIYLVTDKNENSFLGKIIKKDQ